MATPERQYCRYMAQPHLTWFLMPASKVNIGVDEASLLKAYKLTTLNPT